MVILEQAGLIKKYQPPKFGWCYNCNSCNNIADQNKQPFWYCLNCGTCQTLEQDNNYIKYFVSLGLLITFLRVRLNLVSQEQELDNNRLIYLGQKEKLAYYLLLDIQFFNSLEMIKTSKNCYIFCLQDSHNFNMPKKIKLYNLLECFDIVGSKLIFSTPTPLTHSCIGQLGGIASSNKRFGQAREFVWRLFQQKEQLNYRKKKKDIYWEILEELIKKPELILNLSENNLFDWIAKQVRTLQKKTAKQK